MPVEMTVSQARAEIGDITNRAAYRGETTYLTKNGHRSAAVVPAASAELLEELEELIDLHLVRATFKEMTKGTVTTVPFVRRTKRQGS